MTFHDGELIDVIDEITITLGQILLSHRELTEGLLDQRQTDRAKEKIDQLKKRMDDEKEKLTTLRQHQQRRKALEKLRQTNTTEGVSTNRMLALRDQRGRVIGWVQSLGKDRLDVLDAGGRMVGRLIHGKTYDGRGQFVGDGNQGLRVLGQILRRS
jgi:hypothetical protein